MGPFMAAMIAELVFKLTNNQRLKARFSRALGLFALESSDTLQDNNRWNQRFAK